MTDEGLESLISSNVKLDMNENVDNGNYFFDFSNNSF